jgi:uracil-DNA glycosylase
LSAYAELKEIDKEVSNCTICKDLVEKFPKSSTISYGLHNDILLLGEAPANNGWRKSGKAWYGINGNLIPSGENLNYLFGTIGIKLDDLTFTEAIKCYPTKRNHAQECSRNCRNYLIRQINILSPKIIIVLGDKAFRTVCDIKYNKFSEVAGKCFFADFLDKRTIIFPVYHPSPASPLCIKGNLELFKEIEKLIKNHS